MVAPGMVRELPGKKHETFLGFGKCSDPDGGWVWVTQAMHLSKMQLSKARNPCVQSTLQFACTQC